MNVNEVLRQFRDRQSHDTEALEDSFKIFIQDKLNVLGSVETKKRRKKLSSCWPNISTEDVEKINEGLDVASVSKVNIKLKGKRSRHLI